VAASAVSGGGHASVPWVPSWGLHISLTFDGLAAVYGLLATGIGAVVLLYSSAYMPRYLQHHHRDSNEVTLFYALILLFMGAMVGLVMAEDLILLFVFWDLTAVVSYFLIGFDRDEPASRPAALMALLITGGSAIFMLVGIIGLWLLAGTTSVTVLATSAAEGPAFTIAVALIAIAALAKSAQIPLHFWLPRAMVAPTPVSSYLHSAAMVAAGVFLLARLLPIVHRAAWIPQGLVVIGLASVAVGGILALGRDEMKRLLAYSTISQYGYVVLMLGLGGANGAIGAALYVMAHGLAKCALFLTAGAVTEATGRTRLSELGGLLKTLPALAFSSGIAAATIAALPLTIGFFKDELFFTTMHAEGTALNVAAIGAAALSFAYMARFWGSLFLGPSRSAATPLPVTMIGPIALLAILCVAGGVWVEPFNRLANWAGSATLFTPAATRVAYHLDTRPENVMALAAYGVGVVMIATVRWWSIFSRMLSAFAERFGPERWYRGALTVTNALSDRLHGAEVHDLRARVASILLPGGILVGLGLIATSNENAFLAGEITADNLLVVLVLTVAVAAALTATQVTGHLASSLLISAVGFPLAAVYAFYGSPDVALVAVLMETMLALLLIGFLGAMRDRPLIEGIERDPSHSRRGRDRFVGFVAAAASFVVVWGILSKPAAIDSAANDQMLLTPAAHAKDIVTVILADFRGLDTMGEITVIGIVMIGLLTLMQRPRRRTRP
jgi:multicomponent Na+:H+ antiporter subunit A